MKEGQLHKAIKTNTGFAILLLVTVVAMAGCGTRSSNPPLPTSAKSNVNNQLTIPFPYQDKFPSGNEVWILDRDTSNHLVLKVLFKDREVARFPIDGVGATQATGRITLGDREYTVKSLTLNTDQTSGWVTLQ